MRRVLIFLVAALLAVMPGAAQSDAGTPGGKAEDRTEVLRNRILNGDKSSVIVVAHRGDWRYAPENSVAAIEHSISVGVDVVEIDLQLTKDSVLILMHDSKVDRTTTGKGAIKDMILDSIKVLQLKNEAGAVTEQKVPTLEEFLMAAKGKVLVNLDKADRYFDLVMPILRKTGTARQIIIKGAKPASDVKALYGKYLDEVIYMPVVNLWDPEAEELIAGYMKGLKPAAYEFNFKPDTPLDLSYKLKKELDGKALIWYNTMWAILCGGHDDALSLKDPDAAYGFLIDGLGARILQTDQAEYLLKYLKDRNLHD